MITPMVARLVRDPFDREGLHSVHAIGLGDRPEAIPLQLEQRAHGDMIGEILGE